MEDRNILMQGERKPRTGDLKILPSVQRSSCPMPSLQLRQRQERAQESRPD